jgi:hypothetical protein
LHAVYSPKPPSSEESALPVDENGEVIFEDVDGDGIVDIDLEPDSPGSAALSPMEIQEKQFGKRPSINSPIQLWCWRMSASKNLERFILFCILCNTTCLAMEHTRTSCVAIAGGGCVEQAIG